MLNDKKTMLRRFMIARRKTIFETGDAEIVFRANVTSYAYLSISKPRSIA